MVAVKTLEKLFANTRIDPDTGCRIWLGCIEDGYGRMRWRGENRFVHRVVWELIHGSPGAMCVLHTCDNRPCCEPMHLFLGTRLDNADDCVAKGRRPHKLTKVQVAEIKELLVAGEQTQAQIATTYGVRQGSISDIARNKFWKHVPWPQASKEVSH